MIQPSSSDLSVRVPSSYCGLFGMRPSHGSLPLDGVVPLAQTLDTVGWFTNDADLLRRVGEVMHGADTGIAAPHRLLVAEDAFAQAEPAVKAALQAPLDRLAAQAASRELVEA